MVICRMLGHQYFDILDQSGHFVTAPIVDLNLRENGCKQKHGSSTIQNLCNIGLTYHAIQYMVPHYHSSFNRL